ncbi:hypothetical protein FDECE_15007 [Fusarium decemcellulare]|nr:hypothetical protein FDECE_15007 [Fusarium decemcellulare]
MAPAAGAYLGTAATAADRPMWKRFSRVSMSSDLPALKPPSTAAIGSATGHLLLAPSFTGPELSLAFLGRAPFAGVAPPTPRRLLGLRFVVVVVHSRSSVGGSFVLLIHSCPGRRGLVLKQ